MSRSGAVLPAVTFALSFAFAYGPDALRMSLPAALAVSAAAAAVVWLSGRRPDAALGAVVALAAALPVLRSTVQGLELLVVLVVFRAAADPRLRPVVPAVAGFAALTTNDVWQRVAFDAGFATPAVLLPAVLTALAVGLGLQTRRVRAQHAELVALREADRLRAVAEERRRIARDLHDVAAQHLTAVVVRAKVAGRVGTPEALRAATGFAAQTAGEALEALRAVVRVLAAGPEARTDPDDLPATLRRMAAAGLRVEVGALDTAGLTGEPAVAVLRIVQEALANVLRHRGPGPCRLTVRRTPGRVEVTVVDDGRSPAPAGPASVRSGPAGPASVRSGPAGPASVRSGPAGPAPDPVGPERGPARPGGYGLVGMRERAESCGGHLTAGPTPTGGWQVHAVLPLAAGPEAPAGPGAAPAPGSPADLPATHPPEPGTPARRVVGPDPAGARPAGAP